jgi:MFS superfamily sulfate permease-like transporter
MVHLLSKTAAYRKDFSAALVVFLVALPLCLGIALASDAPLQAGIVAGVVGGVVVALFSGSELSVSGPAAGLAVVVAASIHQLGFDVFLLAVVVAGAIQVALGFLRAGIISNYIPNSVIRGMLAAIGLRIILKQIPHALGIDTVYFGDDHFKQLVDGRNTFEEIGVALRSYDGEALVITAVSMLILTYWDKAKLKRLSFIRPVPAALVVVLVAVLLNELFRVLFAGFYLRAEEGHLVNLPQAQGIGSFFTLPAFEAWRNPAVYNTALVLAAIASIETLLSLEATDRLDPRHRISNTNRELRAQGIGNMVSGLLGGLPITSVIVRSSANIFAGAQTRLSAFMHGVLLAVFVALIPSWLNKIPLAALASILIVIGYGLTPPSLYREMIGKGAAQAVPFFVTVLAILFTDLLVGIGIGLVVGLVYALRTHHNAAFTLSRSGSSYYLRFNKDATFLHKTELKNKLQVLPGQCTLVVDAHRAHFIDNDIYDVLAQFRLAAPYRKITVSFLNFERPQLLDQAPAGH